MTTTRRDGRPLSAHIYEQVLGDILDGSIPAGAALIQNQLAENYGVSRTPVRDVLNRLVHDGVAEFVPGGGYVVNDLTTSDIADVYEVRRALEELAVRTFDARYSPLDLARLELAVAEGELVADDDPVGLFETSRRFHLAVVDPSPNAYLRQTLEMVWASPVQRRILLSYLHRQQDKSVQVTGRHRRILDAAARGDLVEMLAAAALCHAVD